MNKFILSFFLLFVITNISAKENLNTKKFIEVKNTINSNSVKFKELILNTSLCDCNKRKPITITSDTAETDFQIMLDVDFSTGMDTDFSDIRFTGSDGTTEIPFWIEEFTASDDATVWVKVPTIPVGNTTIYMYYDDCTSSATSNGNNTFIFFDDMNSTSGWSDYNSGTVVSSTTLGVSTLSKTSNCDPDGGWKLLGATVTNFKLITREIRTSVDSNNSCGLNRYGIENGNYNGYNINRNATGGNNDFGLESRTSASASNNSRIRLNQPIDTWFRTELTRCCASNQVTAQLYGDDRTAIGNLVSSTMPNNRNYCNLDRVTVRGGHDYHIDFMAVAKSTCGTITAVIGAEDGFADLSLTKTVSTAILKKGTNLVYTLTLTNDGPICAKGIEVEDVLPTQLNFVSATTVSGASYSATTNTWDLGSASIAPNTSVTLSITATAISDGSFTNTAKVVRSDKTDPDSDPTN